MATATATGPWWRALRRRPLGEPVAGAIWVPPRPRPSSGRRAGPPGHQAQQRAGRSTGGQPDRHAIGHRGPLRGASRPAPSRMPASAPPSSGRDPLTARRCATMARHEWARQNRVCWPASVPAGALSISAEPTAGGHGWAIVEQEAAAALLAHSPKEPIGGQSRPDHSGLAGAKLTTPRSGFAHARLARPPLAGGRAGWSARCQEKVWRPRTRHPPTGVSVRPRLRAPAGTGRSRARWGWPLRISHHVAVAQGR